jgi:hypothetical protein
MIWVARGRILLGLLHGSQGQFGRMIDLTRVKAR